MMVGAHVCTALILNKKIFVRKTEYFTENSAKLIIQSYKRGLCFGLN